MTKLVVLILGAGNAAHVTAGLTASRENTEARILTLFKDEAERWTKVMGDEGLTINLHESVGDVTVKSKPALITKNPAEAIEGAHMIIFCVPAFTHQGYFEAMEPYIKPNTILVGFPGQPGFEFQCLDILKDKGKKCPILNFESLPWACRINEFGKSATVLGLKVHLQGSILKGNSNPDKDPCEVLQAVIGPETKLDVGKHYLAPILDTKSIVHPPIMYAKWRDWDGRHLSEKPLFYQGLDETQIKYLSGISDECVAAARAITAKRPDIDLSGVVHLQDCYRVDYKDTIGDPTSLFTIMKSNSAYDGLVHPMVDEPDGKFSPNFRYRYLVEDVPDGIVVTKGIALIAGVPTPYHDEVLAWCQKKLGKEYLVGTDLTGKDIKDTRCPQKYGYNTIEDLLSIK